MTLEKIPENCARNTHNVVASLAISGEEGQKVLDIPCGAGAFTDRLQKRRVDVYPADCRNLLQVESKHFVQADMNRKIDYADASFDTVASIDGIEHIERPFDFIRECHRVLKKDGTLVVSTPNVSSLRSRFRWFVTGFHNKCKAPLDETQPHPLHHINMISYPEMRYMLHSNGFKIETITTNRMKVANLVYAVLLPVIILASYMAVGRELKNA